MHGMLAMAALLSPTVSTVGPPGQFCCSTNALHVVGVVHALYFPLYHTHRTGLHVSFSLSGVHLQSPACLFDRSTLVCARKFWHWSVDAGRQRATRRVDSRAESRASRSRVRLGNTRAPRAPTSLSGIPAPGLRIGGRFGGAVAGYAPLSGARRVGRRGPARGRRRRPSRAVARCGCGRCRRQPTHAQRGIVEIV